GRILFSYTNPGNPSRATSRAWPDTAARTRPLTPFVAQNTCPGVAELRRATARRRCAVHQPRRAGDGWGDGQPGVASRSLTRSRGFREGRGHVDDAAPLAERVDGGLHWHGRLVVQAPDAAVERVAVARDELVTTKQAVVEAVADRRRSAVAEVLAQEHGG